MRTDILPIYIGIIVTAALLVGQRQKLHQAWLWGALPLVLMGLCLPSLLGRLGTGQHNLVELLRQDTIFPGVYLLGLCMWGPLTAGWAAGVWRSGGGWRTVCWIPASCLVAWGMLRYSVTVESIQDIFGAPIYAWPADLEYILRFSAVYVPFVWLPMFFALSRKPWAGIAATILFSAVLFALSPMIVHRYTPSDNVSELFNPGGERRFAALCLLAPWLAVLCDKLRRSSGMLACAFVLVLSSIGASVVLANTIRLGAIHGMNIRTPQLAIVFAIAVSTCLMPAVASRHRMGHCNPGLPARV